MVQPASHVEPAAPAPTGIASAASATSAIEPAPEWREASVRRATTFQWKAAVGRWSASLR